MSTNRPTKPVDTPPDETPVDPKLPEPQQPKPRPLEGDDPGVPEGPGKKP